MNCQCHQPGHQAALTWPQSSHQVFRACYIIGTLSCRHWQCFLFCLIWTHKCSESVVIRVTTEIFCCVQHLVCTLYQVHSAEGFAPWCFIHVGDINTNALGTQSCRIHEANVLLLHVCTLLSHLWLCVVKRNLISLSGTLSFCPNGIEVGCDDASC